MSVEMLYCRKNMRVHSMCIVCTHTVHMYSVCVCVVVPEGNVTLLVTPVSVPGRSSSPLAVSAWCRTNFGFPDIRVHVELYRYLVLCCFLDYVPPYRIRVPGTRYLYTVS